MVKRAIYSTPIINTFATTRRHLSAYTHSTELVFNTHDLRLAPVYCHPEPLSGVFVAMLEYVVPVLVLPHYLLSLCQRATWHRPFGYPYTTTELQHWDCSVQARDFLLEVLKACRGVNTRNIFRLVIRTHVDCRIDCHRHESTTSILLNHLASRLTRVLVRSSSIL